MKAGLRFAAGLLVVVSVSSCRQDMHDQPLHRAYKKTDFFGDARSARPLVEGTVARGFLREDTAMYQGKQGADFVDAIPVPVTAKLVERGRQRYGIYCTPCHGQVGAGDGMIVQRGFRRPTSLHVDRLRAQKAGYFFDVITNGFGAMPDYATQVSVEDRWAIVAYVRALQLSQSANPADVAAASGGAATGVPAAGPTEAHHP